MSEPRQLAETFTAELRGVAGSRLQATALFGSAARGEWIGGISDINVIVLLDALDAALLASVAPVVRTALGQGITPLVMESAEWRRAADVFTIELADMKDACVPLFGDNPSDRATVQPAILRLQAERELRAKLLHLHSGMIVAADDGERLGQLFVHALPSFATYLRTALRLAGQPVPQDTRAVVEQGCALVGADNTPLLTVLDARSAGGRLNTTLTDPLADNFNTAATTLANYIDAFGR
jgi:hypothetical protein